MRLLLDTHAFIWWSSDDARLSDVAARAIDDASASAWLSAVTPWEISLLLSKNRLEGGEAVLDRAAQSVAQGAFVALPISIPHAIALAGLPRGHGDPFDRMLIAQAQVENLAIVSKDAAFDAYGIERVW